ncbi:MAG: ABC transporter permease [Clostridia bacterium]|nr:ABC transporter permease [Clostridia bacterium]MBR5010776.1 ABC transporter permease [Clostridia bacterium]MBR5985934.1 ABC transporter permease [Clostridia bacterium]MBR6009748.1 ABC transporter permease [Clostridia bacterium]MBR6499689.1 ABC transporter permease [Clostridia bacterium]
MNYVASQLLLRLNRNAFIVMALIIPIVAGMGINFSITIGAMAAQIGLLLTINWGIQGVPGILLAAGITLPLASLFGFLIGSLLNKMKGQETIGSLILGYFANGAYQLLFLFIFGSIIPLNSNVTIVGASGVQNTLNLTGEVGLYTAVDGIMKIDFLTALYVLAGCVTLLNLVLYLFKKVSLKRMLVSVIASAVIVGIFLIPPIHKVFDGTGGRSIQIPLVTWIIIGALCLFNSVIMRTRLGQKFRAVGQNQTVANASGINVNRTRVIAIMISTVLAGWGQILFMQSEGIGTFQTYAAHEQVGLYAGAAILVGGASIDRATNLQALLGTFLFHSLFITAQAAASNLFGDSVVGEYFRAFLSYGVIAVALILYAWRSIQQKKSNLLQQAGR